MGYAPENTLVSFEEGIRRGADLLEMDVQLSADNEVVVMHDTSVDRTTDGAGFVRDLPWKKLKTFDAGIWYGPDYAGQYVPSLADVIERFRDRKTTKKHPVGLVIELKTVRGSGGSLADAVVALLQRESFTDRCIIISFDAVALQEVRAAHKTLPDGTFVFRRIGGRPRGASQSDRSAGDFPSKNLGHLAGRFCGAQSGVVRWNLDLQHQKRNEADDDLRRRRHCH